jgi:DNA repair protein RadC
LIVALIAEATAINLAHNHSRGNLQASKSVEEITQKIKKEFEYLDINVLDHLIIVTKGKYLSFIEEGLI